MSEKQLGWLKEKENYLKITNIEKDLGMPDGTLRKYVDGSRGLSDYWKPKVIEWIKNFKKL